jgi:hypothetical protein
VAGEFMSQNPSEKRICPVCAAEAAPPFFLRRGVPVHQNSVIDSELAARQVARGDLALAACGRCGFVFNSAFDSSRTSYERDYDNSQDYSNVFEQYVDGHVHHLVADCGVRGANIVEVGCGKGAFLRKLVAADAGNRGWGFDPSYVGPDEDLDGRLKFVRQFYGPGVSGVPADVVICRHVIEHVADPVALLGAVRAVIGPATRVFFETPCFEWILRGRIFWDIFYEHCNYFTVSSLRSAFERADFSVGSASHVFGGQYLWFEASAAHSSTAQYSPDDMERRVVEFAASIDDFERNWRARVERHRADGLVALWGAGAKGVTFANLLDPERALFDCIVDINPRKQGKFTAGTAHPIVAPSELTARGVRHVIAMNPNYRQEIVAQIGPAPIAVHTAEGI